MGREEQCSNEYQLNQLSHIIGRGSSPNMGIVKKTGSGLPGLYINKCLKRVK